MKSLVWMKVPLVEHINCDLGNDNKTFDKTVKISLDPLGLGADIELRVRTTLEVGPCRHKWLEIGVVCTCKRGFWTRALYWDCSPGVTRSLGKDATDLCPPNSKGCCKKVM